MDEETDTEPVAKKEFVESLEKILTKQKRREQNRVFMERNMKWLFLQTNSYPCSLYRYGSLQYGSFQTHCAVDNGKE